MIRKSAIFLNLLAIFFVFTGSSQASQTTVTKNEKGDWTLEVDGKPYFILGVEYRVSKVGQSPDKGTAEDWAEYDYNENGMNDAAYDSWVDTNKNGLQDDEEPTVGDFKLLQDMGVNTIRWYMNDFEDQAPSNELFRDLFESYGIRVAVGNKFGAYTIDSGASWAKGTDYENPQQRKNMLDSVRRMVEAHRDEPYVLLWVLGNENNLRFTNTNAASCPEAYASLLEEAAVMIHELDGGKHPVALVNGDLMMMEYYKQCPGIDIFGVNAYRGPQGFGSLWKEVKDLLDKPVLLAEYGGADAQGLDEDNQLLYHQGCLLDIEKNAAGGEGSGNSIGGFVFEWLDEWWKAGDPDQHALRNTKGTVGVDRNAQWSQEYCGIASQGYGRKSPFLRQLRKTYFFYQDHWT